MEDYFLPKLRTRLKNYSANILSDESNSIAVEDANPKFDADLAIPLFALAKKGKVNISELSQKLVDELQDEAIASMEPLGGYVNIKLKPREVARHLLADFLRTQESYGKNRKLAEQEIVVEHTDPNPFKEFHIGHAYSNTVGESISRLYEASGAKVYRVSYHGDVGMHVAKAIWGIKQLLAEENLPSLEAVKESARPVWLGRAYAKGAKAYENNPEVRAEIEEINIQIYLKSDEQINRLYETGKKWSFDYFSSVYERLGVRFDKQYLESETAKIGKELVQAHIGDVFEESDGAIVFRGEKFGLHTRVFINKQGIATYEAKDLGLAILKDNDFHYDQSVIITANEQKAYFKVMLKALELIKPELAQKTRHISHGEVVLPGGKMSSRQGDVITAVWLLDKLEAAIKEKAPDSPAVSETALAAMKYAFLKSNIGANIVFSFEDAINLEGQSGPNIQYAGVRMQAILDKAEFDANSIEKVDIGDYDWQEERKLLLLLIKYPEVLYDSAMSLEPHKLASYAYELAREFNRYYEHTPVLKAPDIERNLRLILIFVALRTLKGALDVLNIPLPKKM